MQFSQEIKETLKKRFADSGITLEESELDGALNQAYSQFSSTQQTGPAPETPLPVAVALAVEALKPAMGDLFELNVPASAPEEGTPETA